MKKKTTELVFILDKSGSMSGLESDTIGGFNSMLERQEKEEGEALVTTILFDDRYRVIHDRINVKGIKPLTEKEYFVEGTTALLDAIGKTINKLVNVQKNTSEEYRSDKIVFVITTDGMENASREYSYEKIREMIKKQKEKYKWEFIFLGANIDAISTAESFGIDTDRAANYHADSQGVRLNYDVVSEAVSQLRAGEEVDYRWKEKIESDYKSRKK